MLGTVGVFLCIDIEGSFGIVELDCFEVGRLAREQDALWLNYGIGVFKLEAVAVEDMVVDGVAELAW